MKTPFKMLFKADKSFIISMSLDGNPYEFFHAIISSCYAFKLYEKKIQLITNLSSNLTSLVSSASIQ